MLDIDRNLKEKQQWRTGVEYLEYCLKLENQFEVPPKIKLELLTGLPSGGQIGVRDVAITTAFQCYTPGVTEMKARSSEKALKVAKKTLDAGHHTTRMHMYATWKLEGVTRSVIHDGFHDQKFHNSDQQSMRYTEAKMGNFLVPKDLTAGQREIFLELGDYANQKYFEFLKLLEPEVERRLKLAYPIGGWKVESTKARLEDKVKKLTQEVARYLLPIGQFSTLDHTLDSIQLIRSFKASLLPGVDDEERYILARMVRTWADVDPTILDELQEPIEVIQPRDINEEYIREQKKEFDESLGGEPTRLVGIDPGAMEIMAGAVRNVLGVPKSRLKNDEALSKLLDPSQNNLLADVFETGNNDELTKAMQTVALTFKTKLSHAGDSQRQRHRETMGSTPAIGTIYDGTADYSTPMVVAQNAELKKFYDETMENIYSGVRQCIDAGIAKEWALLMLPNGQNVRVVESGNLFNFLHRWKQRLCLLAQEEIFFVSVEQVKQLMDKIPQTEPMLAAPCKLREKAGVRPRCPEGDKWCGQAVFNWKLKQYKERRLI